MNKMLIPILFALVTAAFWGCYGPLIGNAQSPRVDGNPLWSPYKPYLFVGIAYLVIAVFGGIAMMVLKGDSFSFTGVYFPTAKWGFLAGMVGAFGALSLTAAMMTSKGNALLVMPIVFGGAVAVSAIVSMFKLHASANVSPLLWGGMALTVAGVVIVAMNTPHAHAATKPNSTPAGDVAGPLETSGETAGPQTPLETSPTTDAAT